MVPSGFQIEDGLAILKLKRDRFGNLVDAIRNEFFQIPYFVEQRFQAMTNRSALHAGILINTGTATGGGGARKTGLVLSSGYPENQPTPSVYRDLELPIRTTPGYQFRR